MDAAAWAEQHLKHADSGDPFRLEPFQRRMVEALQSGEPMRMVRLARLGVPPEQQNAAHADAVARAVVDALDGGAEPTDPDAVAVLRFLRDGDVELLDTWLREAR